MRYELNSQSYVGDIIDGNPQMGALNSLSDPLREYQSIFYADISSNNHNDEFTVSPKIYTNYQTSGLKYKLEEKMKITANNDVFIIFFSLFYFF